MLILGVTDKNDDFEPMESCDVLVQQVFIGQVKKKGEKRNKTYCRHHKMFNNLFLLNFILSMISSGRYEVCFFVYAKNEYEGCDYKHFSFADSNDPYNNCNVSLLGK